MAKGSGRTAASRAYCELHAFAVSGVSQACLNVLDGEVGKVLQNLLLRHAGGEVIQHIVHGYAHAADAGFSSVLARFDRDDVTIIHSAACRISNVFEVYNAAMSIIHPVPDLPHCVGKGYLKDRMVRADTVIE